MSTLSHAFNDMTTHFDASRHTPEHMCRFAEEKKLVPIDFFGQLLNRFESRRHGKKYVKNH